MEKRKGKGYWCYLVPKRRKPSRNRVGMELGTCYIPGSHGGDTQQRLLLCFSAVHHWEQPMWSLSSWLVSVKGLTWGPAGAHLNCWKHEEGRKGERACRAWSCWSRIPKLETEQGFGLCWRCCSRVSIPNPGHLRRGKAAAEGVKQLPLSWIQPCKVKPSQAGPRNCSWLWQGKGHPQCIPKAAAPMGCAPSVWNSTCGMCWNYLEEPLPGAVCSQGL